MIAKQQPPTAQNRQVVILQWLKQAIHFHQQGRLSEAEEVYSAILKNQPRHADAKLLLGMLKFNQERFQDAARILKEAVALNPKHSSAHMELANAFVKLNKLEDALSNYEKSIRLNRDNLTAYTNRAAVYLHLGKLKEALADFDRVVALKPDFTEAWVTRGNILSDLKRPEAALESYKKALHISPNHGEALVRQGQILAELKQVSDAIAVFDHVLAIDPTHVRALNFRGLCFRQLGSFKEELECYDRALALNPRYADAHNNRAVVLRTFGRNEEALASLDRGLAVEPNNIDALRIRGDVLRDLNRLEQALESYNTAISIKPDFEDALVNKGVTLKDLNRLDDAILTYDDFLKLRPDDINARHNRSLIKLATGDFTGAWQDYDARFLVPELMSNRKLNPHQTRWKGESLSGKRILVYEEQGIGDTIQFVRYLPILTKFGADVTFAVRPSLHRLLQSVTRSARLIELSSDGEYDYQSALLNLPSSLGTTIETIPGDVPYLQPEAELVEKWRRQLGDQGLKIGIAWQGNPQGAIDFGRSPPLREFEPLSRIPGVRLISLQKNHGVSQLADLPPTLHVETLGADFDNGKDAFIDTAAVMASLDLVITSDTSIAHLAGALGCSVWVVLKYSPDWRWLTEREDSPWYPTMRLFRQTERGNWSNVFDRVAEEARLLPTRNLTEEYRSRSEEGSSISLCPDEQHIEAAVNAPTRPQSSTLALSGFNEIAACRAGPMIYNKYDRFIGASLRKYGEFSRGETDLFRQILRPGMTVVEVGANIGSHTVGLSQMVGEAGRVYAFEPQRIVFQTLCANLALNACQNVYAYQRAIGAVSGTIVVPILVPDMPANFGGLSLRSEGDGEIVPLSRLDDLHIARCDFLKIDIEGMEILALQGSTDLIFKSRPVIYVENDRADNSVALIDLLHSWNYRLYDHWPLLFSPDNYANDREDIFPNIVSKNLLCVPRESDRTISGFKEI